MLERCKKEELRVIAVDYDGTVYHRGDKEFNSLEKVLNLAYAVYKSGKEFVFVSGRNTTLELELREIGDKFAKKIGDTFSVWRSGGTGMNLEKITFFPDDRQVFVKCMYSNTLGIEKIKIAIKEYLKLDIVADEKSKTFFKSFLDKKLPEYLVPKTYFALAKPYEGRFFAEKVKVTFVLPSSIDEQEKYIKVLRKKLKPYDLSVGWGRLPFADVSKNLRVDDKITDGKLFMMKYIIKKLKINKYQVATFGDSPMDNNRGLLSFPYSFTNDKNGLDVNKKIRPYILEVGESPIKVVYEAINYLIKQ